MGEQARFVKETCNMETHRRLSNDRADDLPEVSHLLRESPQQVWERVMRVLPDAREQRLFYLLYHCGLRPAEIVALCPQEWSDVREVVRLRAILLRRLLAELPLDAA